MARDQRTDPDVIVIGAGPAGMMAAIAAGSLGARVLAVEQMAQPGRKLLLTGNGRCNATNSDTPQRFIEACGPGARFLNNAIRRFGCRDTVAFFAGLGIELKLDDGHAYFATSGGAAAVLRALVRALERQRVRLVTAAAATALRWSRPGFELETSAGVFRAARLVIATGGRSYPATGSDGSGFALARALGHMVSPLLPGNAPLVLAGAWHQALQGISLPDCRLSFEAGGRWHAHGGGLVFTHFGISGPAALAASRTLAPLLAYGPVEARLDLLPGVDQSRLAGMLTGAAAGAARKQLKGLLGALLPRRLALAIIDRAGLRPDGPAGQLGADQRQRLVTMVKRYPLSVAATRGFGEAMVTLGGVDTAGIDPITMESRAVPGAHFCGEMLDVDGPCGGYNLQIAWTTGHAAGSACGRAAAGSSAR